MNKLITYIYTFFCYFLTTIVLLYFVGFYQNVFVPKQISAEASTGINGLDVIRNFSLILLFGLQHSIMARNWFKKWWKEIIPASVERVTYLLFSSIILGIIILFWQPINVVIWDFRGSASAVFINGLSILGLGIIGVSILSLNAVDFSGWRQVQAFANDRGESKLQTPLLYKFVRHPIYFGFLISFWATPYLTLGHFFFAFLMSAYIYVGAALEERNLLEQFGLEYRIYQQEVAMLIPFLKFPF